MAKTAKSEPLLTPAELAARWKGKVCERTLANWRAGEVKRGPAFRKLGGRVVYPLSAVIAYEQQQTKTTSEG